MSLPSFPDPKNMLSRDQAINAILTSIAMEETALSHIINAEGAKIQYAIQKMKSDPCCADHQELVKVNESAASLIDRLNDMQCILKSKMRLALSALPSKCDEHHPHECHPQKPPCPPKEPPCQELCKSVHAAITERTWCQDAALRFAGASSDCENGVKLCPQCHSTLFLPSSGRKYQIELDLELISKANSSISIRTVLSSEGKIIHSNRYACNLKKGRVHVKKAFFWETPASHKEAAVRVWLLSPRSVKVDNGQIAIAEEAGFPTSFTPGIELHNIQ
jgi:hypothetical protein